MKLMDLKENIKRELQADFGTTMTNLILAKATTNVIIDSKAVDDDSRCRIFIESLANDARLIGTWGETALGEKKSKWLISIKQA